MEFRKGWCGWMKFSINVNDVGQMIDNDEMMTIVIMLMIGVNDVPDNDDVEAEFEQIP